MRATAVILFSPHDVAAAGKLGRFLAAFRTPKRLVGRPTAIVAVPARLDPRLVQEGSAGDDGAALAGIDSFAAPDTSLVVICSPQSATSAWINDRIESFKRQGGTDRILCLIVAGEPNATDVDGKPGALECFAPALKYVMGPDGRLSDVRAEPIAADVRPGKDGWRDACLKIAAGIAGVGYDALKQRALQRRMRMAALAAAAIGTVLLMTSVLTVAALVNQRIAAGRRVEAIAAKEQAELALADAERARGIAEIRSLQAKAMVDGQRSALSLVATGTGSFSGLGFRAVDVLSRLYIQADKASKSTPRFEDAASLVAVAQSLNALRQPGYALEALDAAAAILARLPANEPKIVSVARGLHARALAERTATLLALNRVDEADACLARLQEDGSAELATDEWLSCLSDLLAADIASSRNQLKTAGRMYDDLARRLRSLPVRGNRLLISTEIGRTRVAIKQGDVDRAQTCLDSLSILDGPGLSRQGTLHELYSELSAAMVAAGNSAAAVTLLEQSLAVAAKNDGAASVTLVPQMLTLASLVQPEQPVQARRYHDEAFAACMKALDAFFVPNSVERFPLNLSRLVQGHNYVMQKFFRPTLVPCVTPEYLTEFGPEGMISLLRHLEAFSRFIDRSVAEIRTQPGITPEQKQGIDQMGAAASKLAAVIASQIPPLLVACDAAPPPPKPQPVAVRANVITNSLGMQLVPIEPGEFLMGSPANEPLGNAMEELIHPVEITRPFLIGAHEVTQAQYVAVAGRNPSVFVGDDLPVEHVSWADAAAFCKALGELPAEREAGRRYRLPTEAEWEYCCRAGAATPYHTGRRLLPSQARYAFCSRGEPKQTAFVGSYPPNAWGLHDMHGNVWEWTNDWFSATYYGSTPRGIDPAGPARGTHHTLRGGSASMLPIECHAAFRGEAMGDEPDSKATDSRIAFYGDFGIRVVCEVAEKDRTAAMEKNRP